MITLLIVNYILSIIYLSVIFNDRMWIDIIRNVIDNKIPNDANSIIKNIKYIRVITSIIFIIPFVSFISTIYIILKKINDYVGK